METARQLCVVGTVGLCHVQNTIPMRSSMLGMGVGFPLKVGILVLALEWKEVVGRIFLDLKSSSKLRPHIRNGLSQ